MASDIEWLRAKRDEARRDAERPRDVPEGVGETFGDTIDTGPEPLPAPPSYRLLPDAAAIARAVGGASGKLAAELADEARAALATTDAAVRANAAER